MPRIDWRIWFALLLVATFVLPMVITIGGIDPGRQSQTDTAQQTREIELAQTTARLLIRDLTSTTKIFELGVELFDLSRLAAVETIGVLRMLYKQDSDLTTVVLLDGENQALVEPVFLTASQLDSAGLKNDRFPVDAKDLERFIKRLPVSAAREEQRAFSDVYVDQRRNTALMAGAILVPVGKGKKPLVLGFERSLRRIQKTLSDSVKSADTVVFVVDGGGRLVAHPDGNWVMQRKAMLGHPLVKKFLAGRRTASQTFSSKSGEMLVGAFQALRFVDWAVVVERKLPQVTSSVLLASWVYPAWVAAFAVLMLAGFFVQRGIQARLNELQELQKDYTNRADELKRVQASLLETRKLNAIGDLGAGVAHEFNNPIGGILGLTQLLLRKKKDDDPDLQFLTRIESEAKRCKVITDNLLRFSEQQGAEHREPLKIERVLDMAADLTTSRMARQRVQIVRDYLPDCPRMVGNEGALQRAFLNVLLNAETAMPEGGTLTLKTASEADWLVVQVVDTGRGIAKENLQRVFEPFFTTKDNWRGAGLGLWVVYQIVQDHDGGVSIASEEGKGTVVTFRFRSENATKKSVATSVPLA